MANEITTNQKTAQVVYEIAYAPASEACQRDSKAIEPALRIVRRKAAAGYGIFFGTADEEEPMVIVILAWPSLKTHYSFAHDAEYPAFLELLDPALGGPIIVNHVHFVQDPRGALAAPETKIVWLKQKEGVAKKALVKALDKIGSFLDAHAGRKCGEGKKHGGSVYGSTVEDPEMFIMIMGWESVEEAVEGEALEEMMAEMEKWATWRVVHFALREQVLRVGFEVQGVTGGVV
ncbi:hypothetical protein FA95DRAFT_1602872 [Auriscalpium vulgare]|uniref:Uncharacterized protein n=1 Tax=Auriscalpium vulgare TaxID=40419 RepID=A0ACB8S5M0_9AGAM|nr:hypothetical protein FA95DRAFT_1602872 [Auriscalpium vulgare]